MFNGGVSHHFTWSSFLCQISTFSFQFFFHVNQLMFTKCIFTQISLLITSLYSTNFSVIFHASSLFKLDLLELIIATLPQTPEFIADGAHSLGIFSAIILSEWLHQEYALQSNSMNPTIRSIVHSRTNARLNQERSAACLYYSSSTRSIIACGLFLARVNNVQRNLHSLETHAAFDFVHNTPASVIIVLFAFQTCN